MRASAAALDDLYKRYGFSVQPAKRGIRVYLLRQGYFHGVEIVPVEEGVDLAPTVREYTEAGYLTRTRAYENLEDAESALFEGFFSPDETRERLEREYNDFVAAQSKALGSQYSYVPCRYSENAADEHPTQPLLEAVLKLTDTKGPRLIIIEAAAGFGKTCTAYEALHGLVGRSPRLPLFVELARNRQARLFRYVLLDEVDRHYPGLMHAIVQDQVRCGRIPLIVDGFDELLAKPDATTAADAGEAFQDAETMLETISHLLRGDAKIILTTRKTAIFAGDDFHAWLAQHGQAFETTRFSLEEPSVADWLGPERSSQLSTEGMPHRHLFNPVLLSFLRNLEQDDFDAVCANATTLVSEYFDRMLRREQERQALRIPPEEQLRIFRQLAYSMACRDISADSRDGVKATLMNQNQDYLEKIQRTYSAADRPSIEDLANTLATHALLDRAGRRTESVGFVNDFVFGTLAGDEATVTTDEVVDFRERMLSITTTAFRGRERDARRNLWRRLELALGCSDTHTRLVCDINLLDDLGSDVENATLEQLDIYDADLSEQRHIRDTVFTNCRFVGVRFHLARLANVGFLSCAFQECEVEGAPSGSRIWCRDCNNHDSGIIDRLVAEPPASPATPPKDYRRGVLEQFWPKGRSNAERRRALRTLLQGFDRSEHDGFGAAIESLRRDGILRIQGSTAELVLTHMDKIRAILGRDRESST